MLQCIDLTSFLPTGYGFTVKSLVGRPGGGADRLRQNQPQRLRGRPEERKSHRLPPLFLLRRQGRDWLMPTQPTVPSWVAIVARDARRAASRKTKRTPSELARRETTKPKGRPRDRYDRNSSRQAINRACCKAFVSKYLVRMQEVMQGDRPRRHLRANCPESENTAASCRRHDCRHSWACRRAGDTAPLGEAVLRVRKAS